MAPENKPARAVWTGIFIAALCALCFGCQARGISNDLLAGKRPSTATFARAPERVTDGLAAVPGDGWDTELTTLIDPGGGIEWDLGEPRTLTHALIVADHDDFYTLSVSPDGRAWKQVWEASSVEGKGQARRATASVNASGRFVRLEPHGGDGTYSVSELAIASKPSADWPPRFTEKRGKHRKDSERTPVFGALGVALALALMAFFVDSKRVDRLLSRAPFVRDRLTAMAVVLATLFVVTAVGYATEYRYRVIDDSYISFQYAKNLASGNGPVFNPGERVEGYTNFLWVVLMTPFWWITRADPELFTRCVLGLTIALGVTAIFLLSAIGKIVFGEDRSLRDRPLPGTLIVWLPAALALFLLGYDDSFVAYAALGLENHLLIACMLASVWFATAKPKNWPFALGVSFALVVMTRPDGMLWVGTYFVANALSWFPKVASTERVSSASLLRAGGTFAGLWGAYFAWRYAYYGYPLPNTFYLKVGATFAGVSRGLTYLGSFVADRYGVPLLALGSVLAWRTPWVRWLLLHAMLHAAYVVYVGGDFYPGHRFLFALIPTLALLSGAAVHSWSLREPQSPKPSGPSPKRKRSKGPRAELSWLPAAAVVICVAVRGGTILHGAYPHEVMQWVNKVDNNVRYMKWLDTARRDHATMVVGDIGASGFFANLHVFDVFGIVDPNVAHKPVEDFGTGKAGHEKVASPDDLIASHATYIKWGYIEAGRVPRDYYIFNAFPPSIRIEGLWVKGDNETGYPLEEDAFHFDAKSLGAWTRTGDAFEAAGSDRLPRGQRTVRGRYSGFVDSYTSRAGDRATGSLLSPEFILKGEKMRLLVGGGRDPERLRVSLLVDGGVRFSETGTNFETLGRREWDLRGLAGKAARIEIVDEARGNWGHILVDEIVQWTGPISPKL